MADDAFIKDSVFGGLLALLIAAVSWLFKTSLVNKETIKVQELQIKQLEGRVDKVERVTLTKEHVREVIEEALDRRDVRSAERRTEWADVRNAQTREVVAEELERILPRYLPQLPQPPRHRPTRPSGPQENKPS